MSSRTVKLTLEADAKGLVSGLKIAQKATSDFGRDVESWRKKNEAHLDTIGDASGKAGLAAAAGLGLIGKAAIDWESSWTGVLKTVDEAEAKFYGVESGLRSLAKELPSTHTEIAAVAEAAGQLGVATEDVVSFTKVMIDLGESTNMSAETAATQLARFSNIMGTSNKDVNRLGATLVGLGNNFATTESEIMDMSMRLAGSSKQIGLSEGQTMGLAAAMSSVGIEAEAGGTAMSTTMKKVGKAVDAGSGSVSEFAKTAGMSSEEFIKAWKDDAGGALQQFVVGLGRAGDEGESVNAILTELGITGIRESDALLRLSAAGELMGDAMKRGGEEFQAGTALLEEANKRYATTESKIKMAWNGIKDAAIEAGGMILPVIAGIADGASSLAETLSQVPKPVQAIVMAIGALAAAGGLGAFAIIKTSKTLGDLREALSGISSGTGRASKAIGGLEKTIGVVGKAAGVATVALIAMAVAGELLSERSVMTTEDYANAVLKVAKAGEEVKGYELDSIFQSWDKAAGVSRSGGINSLAGAVREIANPSIGDQINKNLNFLNGLARLPDDKLTAIEEKFKSLGNELGRITGDGHADQAAASFRILTKEFENNGQGAAEALAVLPGYSDALRKIANDAGESVTDVELLEWALTGVAPAAVSAAAGLEAAGGVIGYVGDAAGKQIPVTKDMAKALQEVGLSAEGSITGLKAFTDYLFASGLAVMSSRDAAFKWSDTLRDMGGEIKKITDSQGKLGKVLEKGGKDFNKNTDSGMAANEKFQGVLREGIAVAQTYAADSTKSQKDVQKQLEATYEAGIKTAEGFDIGAGAAEALVRKAMDIPKDVSIKSWMEDTAAETAESITGAVQSIPDEKSVKVQVSDDGTVTGTQSQIDGIIGRSISTTVTDEGTIHEIQGGINNVKGKTEHVLVADDGTIKVVQGGIDGVKDGSALVAVTEGGMVAKIQGWINNIKGKSVTISATYETHGVPYKAGLSVLPAGVKRASGGSVFGPGTETSDSIPALLSNSEHVWTAKEVRGAGGHANVETLRDLARRGELPAFAKGGRVGAAEKKVKSLKRSYESIPGGKANRTRKLSAKWAYEDAKKELASIKAGGKKAEAARKKAEAARKKAEQEEREKQARLREGRFDLRTEARRGSVTDAFTNGGGMSYVDKMFDASNNKDLSKKQRANMRSLGYKTEKELLKLEKRAESVEKKIDKAVDARDRLLSARNGARDQITGSFDLGGMLGQKDGFGYNKHVGKKGLLAYGKSLAAGAKTLSQKVKSLQKLGFNESMIDQVIDEWTNAGTFELANAMLSMNKAERGQFNKSFKDLGTYATRTGNSLTEAMAKGGLNAAETIVNTLKKEEKSVETAFYKLGKAGQKGFHKAWGIASPAKEAKKDVGHIIDGQVLAIKDQGHRFTDAMAGLYATPAFSVPPSPGVARYAAQPASAGVVIDYDKLASAMTKVQLRPVLSVSKNAAADMYETGAKQAVRRQ